MKGVSSLKLYERVTLFLKKKKKKKTLCKRESIFTLGQTLECTAWLGPFSLLLDIREFKQIATAGATTAAVTEKVWGDYVAAVRQILAK